MILITGGTGLVGSHLLYNLISENKKVRATYRREKTLDRVKKVFSYYTDTPEQLFDRIEWIEADITNIPALKVAFQNVSHVYHCAAFVSFEPDKYNQLRKINIEGTANVVNLCILNKIQKLCYVSSIAAIGNSTYSTATISENSEWNPEYENSVYAITKYGAEMEVWRGTQEGVEAVVVNPGIILGPGYWKGGGSGSLIKKIDRGLKYYPTGSSGYIDVWDTVNIMQQLMDSSIKNERYILVAQNLSFKNFQDKVAVVLKASKSKKAASDLLLAVAWRMDWLNNKIFGRRRTLSKQMAKSINTESIYDNSKIEKDLNYKFQDINESIEKVCQFYLKDKKKS